MSEAKQKWEGKITRAKKCQEEWKGLFRVDMALAYFEGRQKPDNVQQADWITLNMIYSHLMAQLPTLYSVDPYFYVKLKRSFSPNPRDAAEWDQRGRSRQAYLNYLKGELGLKNKARLGIQDAHFSIGVMKTFYSADLTENDKAGQPLLDELGKEIKNDAGEVLKEPDMIPINGRYTIKRVDPDNFFFDDEAGPLPDNWSWLAERFCPTVEEIRKDKRFSKKVVKQIEARARNNKKSAAGLPGEEKISSIEDEPVECFEIYDLKRNQWLIYCEYAEDLVMEPRAVPAAIDKHPYSILRFVMRGKSAYPIPPLSQGLDSQREYNTARSDILKHRKRFNRKYEVATVGLEDPDNELAKLESGDDGTIIRKQTLDQVVRPIQDAPMDQQRYVEIGYLKADMAELLGASDNARGVAASSSATEADILDSRFQVREGDRLSIVVEWLTDIAQKLDALVQAHIEADEAVKITGPQGEFWHLVKVDDYDDIKGEYEYSVNVGSTQARLPQLERAQWLAFWSQVVIPMPAILTRPNVMKKFAEMFGIEDDAMLNDLRELGLQMMQGQIPQPKTQGSAPGVPEMNPQAIAGGQAFGAMGGTANGGGYPG